MAELRMKYDGPVVVIGVVRGPKRWRYKTPERISGSTCNRSINIARIKP